MHAARQALARMTATAMQEDMGLGFTWEVGMWSREPLPAIAALERAPRDWIRYWFQDCPKAYLLGEARLMAQQENAARRDFQRALDLLDQRLRDDANNTGMLALKAKVLLRLGEREAAVATYRLVQELGAREDLQIEFEPLAAAIAHLETRVFFLGRPWSFGNGRLMLLTR